VFLGKDRRFRIIVRHKSRLGIVKQLVVSLIAKRRFSDSETAYLWPRNGISMATNFCRTKEKVGVGYLLGTCWVPV
jgi:hypothetical protein